MTRVAAALAGVAVAGLVLGGCAAPRRLAAPPLAPGQEALPEPPASRPDREGPAARPESLPSGEDGAADARAAAEVAAFREALVARARSHLGARGPFVVRGARFNPDCSGFVQAVFEGERVPLRALAQEAAPDSRVGTAATYLAAAAFGETFGAAGSPAPGDLVFWHDTYDRNRNRRADDRFTHVGLVEEVRGGTVVFLHRGSKGVARGHMTLARPGEAEDAEGRVLNSPLRERGRAVARAPTLAGALFAAYGRIDPRRLPGGDPPAVAAR